MKFTLEIELGNEAMQTGRDIENAMIATFSKMLLKDMAPPEGAEGIVRDVDGNTVGKWQVTA